jgi:hypothetical protein
MTHCFNFPNCREEVPEANPGENVYCPQCAVALFQKLLMEPCDDPTALQCKNCRSFYSLNSPRVRRAIETQAGDNETPELCWVCARLYHAAHQEATN